MTKVSLSPVRYYDVTDIYTASVDNRPLKDISANIGLLNDAIQALGFYQELYASLDVEPPGGFTPFTCVAVTKANTLIPIDISLSTTAVNYSTLPLYLIIEPLGHSLYKCISFSSSISLPSNNNMFLAESIGKAIKVGPSGTLVDEIFFDIYYGSEVYQQIVVGKVLTQSTFSFGGNQVNTLGDNRFLAKDRNDTTTGLITRLIDLQDSNIAVKSSIMPDTISGGGAYAPHSSYINSVAGASTANPPSRSPVYFSYTPLPINSLNGDISGNVDSLLNEVHFATLSLSPVISGSSSLTTGVNQSALLDFTSSYLLHNATYSAVTNETTQSLGTSLTVGGAAGSVNLGGTNFTFDTATLDPLLAIDPLVLSGIVSSPAPGICFGGFKSDSLTNNLGGGYLGFAVVGGIVPTTTSFDVKGPSDFSSTNTLVLYAKKASSNTSLGAASLHLVSDGYLFLGAPNGAYYNNTPVADYEITNKVYVDTSIKTLSDASLKKVPLAGTTIDVPITGSLYFDTTSSATPNVGLIFNTLTSTEIHSNSRVEVRNPSDSTLQIVCGRTPVDSSASDWTADAFATWQHVENRVNSVTAGSLTSYLDKTTNQTVTSIKTFAEKNSGAGDGGIVIESTASVEVRTKDPVSPTTGIIKVPDGVTTFKIKSLDSSTVTLLSKPTEDSDGADSVVTKGYLADTIDLGISKIINSTAVYAIWGHHLTPATTTAFAGYTGYRSLTQGAFTQASTAFISHFGTSISGTDGLTYVDANGRSALFMVTCSEARIGDRGPDQGGNTYRATSVIAVKSSGLVTTISFNQHQDDTDGNSINSLVGTSQSSVVALHPGDTLAALAEWCTHGSVSVTLIRYLNDSLN